MPHWEEKIQAGKRLIGQSPQARAVFLTLLVIWMIVIFLFSSQGADDTMRTSSIIAEPIVHFVKETFRTDETKTRDTVQFFVRKTAHFLEYAVLGALFLCVFFSFSVRHPHGLSVICSCFYAISDELHQFLGGERSGMWQDVLLDTMGAIFGVLFFCLIIMRITEKKRLKKV